MPRWSRDHILAQRNVFIKDTKGRVNIQDNNGASTLPVILEALRISFIETCDVDAFGSFSVRNIKEL